MVRKWPVIFARELARPGAPAQVMRNQLTRWQAKGLVLKLKRGVYILRKDERMIRPSEQYIANQLYVPSYVSMEYALGLYGLIPERVHDITSITTRKTMRIKNDIGTFVYQHIKPAAFRGFHSGLDDAGLTYFIADPEKAIVDFCYLNLGKLEGDYGAVLRESFRFQNIGALSCKKVARYASAFGSSKLSSIALVLRKMILEEKR
jgi:predicted transcriptional regulator of viral defense system